MTWATPTATVRLPTERWNRVQLVALHNAVRNLRALAADLATTPVYAELASERGAE